jgi:hypothetical protein
MPPRTRTPSGHDIPIPESVFHALSSVQAELRDSRQARETWQANHDSEHKQMAERVEKAVATRSQSMIDLAKVLVPAVVLIIGGQRALAPTPQPARIEVVETPVTRAIAPECMSLQPGTTAQTECFARVLAEIQSGKRSPSP